MTIKRSASFSWSSAADFDLDAGIRRRLEQAALRLTRICARLGPAKNQFLTCFKKRSPDRFQAELTFRHGRFLYYFAEQGPSPADAFEAACVKVERKLERLRRFQRKLAEEEEPVRPLERTGWGAPEKPEDLLREMAADYLRRLRRSVRRRLRTEAIVHPDWPIGEISDGDIVDEAIARILSSHPKDIPYGAFWPWAPGICEDVLDQRLEELRRRAETTVSLDESLAEADEVDDGYDIERPYHIIQRILEPAESELADATPDERSQAPSTVAEYHDFVRCLHEAMASWPREDQQMAECYCFEGMTAREISRLQKRPQADVLDRLKTLLPRLRQAMGEGSDADSESGERTEPAK